MTGHRKFRDLYPAASPAPTLSGGEPTPDLTDWIDPEMTAKELAELGAAPKGFVEAQELLSLIRLAAMDGYNKQPVSTVDDWVDECKKRVFLLYLATTDGPVSPSLSTSSPELKDLLDALLFAHEEVVANAKGCDTRPGSAKRCRAARSAIELSFATLKEEIKRLKLWIPDCDVCGYPFDEHDRKNGYCFHGGIGEDATSYEAKPSEEIAHAIRTLRSENERLRLDKTGLEQWKELAQKDLRGLRATALTPEDASQLLEGITSRATRDKLRLISETPK